MFCPILDKFLRNKPLAAPTFYLFQLVPYRLIDGYLLPSYERAPSLTLWLKPVQVAKADFEKMNEFAEAAMIVRNPSNASDIRAQRKRLLEK